MSQELHLSGLTQDGRRDEFFYLCAMNRATLVTNTKEGLLKVENAKRYAPAMAQVTKMGEDDATQRPDRILAIEPKLIEIVGPEVTEVHVGRSSQDMHATYRMAIMRDDVLAVHAALNDLLATFSQLAETHRDVVVPSYTNGVAAQPNSLGHYFLGVSAALVRCRTRLEEHYARVNRCPMGGTVLNGTGWPLNRDAMAHHLGFDSPIPNALDATQGAPSDCPVEFAQIMQSIALPIGILIQDILVQYAQPRPWMILQEGGDNTYVSSAMPQKRNPGLMNNTRTLASSICAGAVEMAFLMHNLSVGMQDPKNVSYRHNICKDTLKLMANTKRILNALRINPDRAVEELNSDWTATQEVADRLMSQFGIPFRIGHHVASAMVGYARKNGLKPLEFPYAKMQELFLEVTRNEWHECELPMSEEEFRDALNPRTIVANRKTAGGPQPASMDVLIAQRQAANDRSCQWNKEKSDAIVAALANLEAEFNAFL